MANTMMSVEQFARAWSAADFKAMFDEVNPDRPMTQAEVDRWVFRGIGPTRTYQMKESPRIDILHGHSAPKTEI